MVRCEADVFKSKMSSGVFWHSQEHTLMRILTPRAHVTVLNRPVNYEGIFMVHYTFSLSLGDKDGSKVTTVAATPGQGPDRPQEVSYTDTKVIGNGSFGVVYQAKLCDTGELVAIKKVLQDKRFKV